MPTDINNKECTYMFFWNLCNLKKSQCAIVLDEGSPLKVNGFLQSSIVRARKGKFRVQELKIFTMWDEHDENV